MALRARAINAQNVVDPDTVPTLLEPLPLDEVWNVEFEKVHGDNAFEKEL